MKNLRNLFIVLMLASSSVAMAKTLTSGAALSNASASAEATDTATDKPTDNHTDPAAAGDTVQPASNDNMNNSDNMQNTSADSSAKEDNGPWYKKLLKKLGM